MARFGIKSSRLKRRSVHTGESHQCTFACEAAHIANLRHELRSGDWPGSLHCHNDLIFRQHRGQMLHLVAKDLQGIIHRIQAVYGLRNDQLGAIILGKRGNRVAGNTMNPFGIRKRVVVSGSFAPFLEGVCKRRQRRGCHAVFMPKSPHKIHPLYVPRLGALLVEQLICTREGLIQQRNQTITKRNAGVQGIIAALMIILEGAGSIYISFLLVPLEVASMLITLANSDEQWKWGKYAVALPISKRQIVSSRYAFGGIAAIIGLCVALVVNTISYFCFPAYQFGFYLFLSIASFCMVLLFLAFILPSNYWLGVNAGFAVMFILIILLVVLGIWSRMTNNAIMGFVVDNFDLSMAIGFVSTIVIFALSYILSVGLFKRKYC